MPTTNACEEFFFFEMSFVEGKSFFCSSWFFALQDLDPREAGCGGDGLQVVVLPLSLLLRAADLFEDCQTDGAVDDRQYDPNEDAEVDEEAV